MRIEHFTTTEPFGAPLHPPAGPQAPTTCPRCRYYQDFKARFPNVIAYLEERLRKS